MPKPRPATVKPSDIVLVVHHSASSDVNVHPGDLIDERKRRNEGYNVIIDDVDAEKDAAKGSDGKAVVVQDVPDDQISNGAFGGNQTGLHVCVDGNFEIKRPTPDEVEALVQVLAAKAKRLGWRKGDAQKKVKAHREVGLSLPPESRYVTACPGRYLIELMPRIRDRVDGYLPE